MREYGLWSYGSNNISDHRLWCYRPFLLNSNDESLLNEGIAKPHPFGGIYVCPHTICARPGFYAAGEIVRGVFYSTNAFWFNVRLTRRIADCIFSTS